MSSAVGVPSTVAASLTEELTLLSDTSRVVLAGAAVAGDPFEPELAAAAAGTSEESAMDAVDELLRLDLIRQTNACRGVSAFGIRSFGVRSTSPRPAPGGWVRTSVAPRRSRSEGPRPRCAHIT